MCKSLYEIKSYFCIDTISVLFQFTKISKCTNVFCIVVTVIYGNYKSFSEFFQEVEKYAFCFSLFCRIMLTLCLNMINPKTGTLAKNVSTAMWSVLYYELRANVME